MGIPAGHSRDEVTYHEALLIEAGLVHGEVARDSSGVVVAVSIISLTWQGHEFIDAARNSSIWRQTRELIAERSLTVSMAVLQGMLVETIKRYLQ